MPRPLDATFWRYYSSDPVEKYGWNYYTLLVERDIESIVFRLPSEGTEKEFLAEMNKQFPHPIWKVADVSAVAGGFLSFDIRPTSKRKRFEFLLLKRVE